MKARSLKVIGITTCIIISTFLISWSNKDQNKKTQPEQKEKIKVEGAQAYFYNDTPNKGMVHRDKIADALKHNLIVKDINGKEYPVIFYQFMYVDMNIYADSTGRDIVVPEYHIGYGRDGLMPEDRWEYFDYHASFGDTLVIEKVQYLLPDSSLAEDYAKGMRIHIDDDE